MKRRDFIYGVGAAGALFTGNTISGKRMPVDLSDCGCDASPFGQQDKVAYQIPTTSQNTMAGGKVRPCTLESQDNQYEDNPCISNTHF